MNTIDPKRNGVKLQKINEWPDDDYCEPGLAINKYDNHLSFACPGCGKFGSILVGLNKLEPNPSWKVESGTLDELNLTLSPSIHCIGCCGWHGYLRNGIFESC